MEDALKGTLGDDGSLLDLFGDAGSILELERNAEKGGDADVVVGAAPSLSIREALLLEQDLDVVNIGGGGLGRVEDGEVKGRLGVREEGRLGRELEGGITGMLTHDASTATGSSAVDAERGLAIGDHGQDRVESGLVEGEVVADCVSGIRARQGTVVLDAVVEVELSEGEGLVRRAGVVLESEATGQLSKVGSNVERLIDSSSEKGKGDPSSVVGKEAVVGQGVEGGAGGPDITIARGDKVGEAPASGALRVLRQSNDRASHEGDSQDSGGASAHVGGRCDEKDVLKSEKDESVK